MLEPHDLKGNKIEKDAQGRAYYRHGISGEPVYYLRPDEYEFVDFNGVAVYYDSNGGEMDWDARRGRYVPRAWGGADGEPKGPDLA